MQTPSVARKRDIFYINVELFHIQNIYFFNNCCCSMQTVPLTINLLYADLAFGTIILRKWYVKDNVMAPLRVTKRKVGSIVICERQHYIQPLAQRL